ncbi:hypothetical protein CFIMG_008522RA00001 [Ceratocystis fimbriata CBS 114723]|uniref:Uncharacterized protein n=1 Tax=Ceratocystis fimbriata CBS 114723 TaxID=1035309 RepID=A0A2C5X912_9PEZI|nr:hypothetical protein CFIMG_008522RA00001 [Ceratocystis fimbriata CBS 114723]
MDEAYNKHARKNRSLNNLNFTSMAPVTSRMTPIDIAPSAEANAEAEGFPFYQTPTPTTNSRNSAFGSQNHVHFSAPVSPSHGIQGNGNNSGLTPITPRRPALMAKSKSHANFSTHRQPSSSSQNPRLNSKRPPPLERQDSDWLPRAGAVMANSAREFKGQSWLVSRDSSTSFASLRSGSHFYDGNEGDNDGNIAGYQRSHAENERITETRASLKRGSYPASAMASPSTSRHGSRHHSRNQSRVSFAGLTSTQTEPEVAVSKTKDRLMLESMMGPDFVALDDRLEAEEVSHQIQGLQPNPQDEEAAVRRLIREGVTQSSWINMLMGWNLSAEGGADLEECEEDLEEDGLFNPDRRRVFQRHFEGVSNAPEERVEPPKTDEGGWSDAAWLLSVVSKVIL